jgi:hypothetical protein
VVRQQDVNFLRGKTDQSSGKHIKMHHKEMLPSNAAEPGRSIWDGVGRKTLEERIDALHRTRFVPESRILLEKDWPKQRSQDVLPFATEKQLCEDLSFIAAREYGVSYVIAATVEPMKGDPWGLTLRLAANEGVCNHVIQEIGKILRILERCAQKSEVNLFTSQKHKLLLIHSVIELPRDQCIDEALDTVVKLNKNRILGRLASKLFRRPSYERRPLRNPLTVRFTDNLLYRNQQSRSQY